MDGILTAVPDHDYFWELLPGQALDCLDADEAELLRRHLNDCPPCAEELVELSAVADELALAAPEARPSPELRRRLLAQVGVGTIGKYAE